MKLSLSTGRDTRNNIFCEDGSAIYKATTSFAITGRVTTISKIMNDGTPRTTADEDRFYPIAKIDWHVFKSPVLRFEDGEVKSKENFYSTGLETDGDDRVFFGPNGQEYQWRFSTNSKPKLYLSADSDDILIASFHGSSLGIRSPRRTAYLEIFPGGYGITDVIVATFIYVDRLSKKQPSGRGSGTTYIASRTCTGTSC
ncbi:hypothetical protein PC9H_007071 [Pleurotus ostreatus]|uniref:DUF6593 domain-containing protein n=1 Tax=Pleurotus ostreatus TaxID=5322 RepID=A0A8H6ZQF0_PLEOS|nr:uncharacterized protein PC9H_007071 [Pleurotus ostreatus]KAF7427855.1 hypothetical protein PC9H_007071 [Pleurotus ostreatus]